MVSRKRKTKTKKCSFLFIPHLCLLILQFVTFSTIHRHCNRKFLSAGQATLQKLVKLKSLLTPWRRNDGVDLHLQSFLTSATLRCGRITPITIKQETRVESRVTLKVFEEKEKPVAPARIRTPNLPVRSYPGQFQVVSRRFPGVEKNHEKVCRQRYETWILTKSHFSKQFKLQNSRHSRSG